MFDRILIPLDGSALAEAILPQVERLARGARPELTLVRVVDVPIEIQARPDVVTALREQAQTYVSTMITKLEAAYARVHGHVHVGDAAGAVLDVAAESGADLIAMTTHGYTGLSRWFFGSVAERVLRASKIPVLMMKSFEEPGTAGSPAARAAIRKILVPVDGSKESEQILPFVRELANRFDAEATLYYVVEAETYGKRPTSFEAGDYLSRLVEKMRAHGGRVVAAGGLGYPAAQIVEFAGENGFDLIAMTTHGRAGLSRWWLGSVAEKVVRHITKPILLVRTQGGKA